MTQTIFTPPKISARPIYIFSFRPIPMFCLSFHHKTKAKPTQCLQKIITNNVLASGHGGFYITSMIDV